MSTLDVAGSSELLARRAARDTGAPRVRLLSAVPAAVGPNWFAWVMGTGIVATGAALLPVKLPGLQTAAVAVWALAAALLVLLSGATAIQWLRHGEIARSHHNNPAMAQFYGAPPMAALTVGAGALLVGRQAVGLEAGVALDEALWVIGTASGLASAVAVPYLMFTRYRLAERDALATWLMPVVPPMVSAASGAGLVVHLPAGQLRQTLLLFCYAEFGLSFVAALISISLLWARLVYRGVGPRETVPTLWIVLGPLGTSITAVCLLARTAGHAIAAPDAKALEAMALLYGVPVWGFAMLWVCLAAAITLRTVRSRLPFSLTWWSFTFPVGTVATGTSELALRTDLLALRWLAVVFYAALVAAWVIAGHGTLRYLRSDELLRPVQVPAFTKRSTTPATPGVN